MENLLTIILTSLITAVFTVIVSWIVYKLTTARDKQEELERRARFLAIRVVCALDPFVSQCTSFVYDRGVLDVEGTKRPNEPEPTVTLPDNVDWRAIKPDLMYRILSFPNAIEAAQISISVVAVHIYGPPDYEEIFDERIIQFGKLGTSALELATELRKTYNIPMCDYGDWAPKEIFATQVAKAEKNKADRESRQAQFISDQMRDADRSEIAG